MMIQKFLSKIKSYSMKPVNDTVRQREIRSFSILLFVTGAVLFLLLSSLLQNNAEVVKPKNETVAIPQSEKLVEYDEMLHKRLNHLQQLDEQYALLIEKKAAIKSLDSLNVVIHQEEEYFGTVVNSISQNITAFTDEIKMKQFVKMITSFKSVITYRAAISNLRNAVIDKMEEVNTDPDILTKPADDTDERNSRISQAGNFIDDLKETKAGETGQAEKEHASVLKEKADQLENRIAGLATANKSLKEINSRLQQQQSETNTLQQKAGSLQEKIDILTAEIQLTRVDYNLLKMGAVPANANPGKRKELFSEASLILTNLSDNDNADIRRKVKDKVLMLNHIAAGIKD